MTSKEHLEVLKRLYIQATNKTKVPYTVVEEEHFKVLERELETLKKYRSLFKKIKKSEHDLEYSGTELLMYYEEIEEK